MEWASLTWPYSSCSRYDFMPWTTPGTPRPMAAPPAASTPTNRAGVSTNPAKVPAALDPPREPPRHPRVRVRAHDRPEAVVGRLDRGDPVPHGLVDGVLQGPAARGHRAHLG